MVAGADCVRGDFVLACFDGEEARDDEVEGDGEGGARLEDAGVRVGGFWDGHGNFEEDVRGEGLGGGVADCAVDSGPDCAHEQDLECVVSEVGAGGGDGYCAG